jgi:hypothetical protein
MVCPQSRGSSDPRDPPNNSKNNHLGAKYPIGIGNVMMMMMMMMMMRVQQVHRGDKSFHNKPGPSA